MTKTIDTLTDTDFDGLRAVQEACHENARAKGFHDVADRLKAALASGVLDEDVAKLAALSYAGNRLFLVAGEATEAHEEVRSGHDPAHQYIGEKGKPEGVPSELADVVIRAFDFAGEFGIDLAGVIQGKMQHNSKRERLHGGRSF